MYDKINQVEKEGYEVVGELETQKDSDNNITAYIQLFKKTSKSTKQYVINTCTVSSEDLGDDVYFGASYTNGKTTIKGTYLEVTGGVHIEENFLGFSAAGAETDITLSYSKHITTNNTANNSRSVSFTIENVTRSKLGTYNIVQVVTGTEYKVLSFTCQPIYDTVDVLDKKGKPTGKTTQELNHKAWLLSTQGTFFVNESEYFKIVKK